VEWTDLQGVGTSTGASGGVSQAAAVTNIANSISTAVSGGFSQAAMTSLAVQHFAAGAAMAQSCENPPPLTVKCTQPAAVCNDAHCADQYWVEKINLDDVWEQLAGTELPEIAVAVIDSGVNYDHPDMNGGMWRNACEFNGTPCFDDDGNGIVDDIYGAAFTENPVFDRCFSSDSLEVCGTGVPRVECGVAIPEEIICKWCNVAGDPADAIASRDQTAYLPTCIDGSNRSHPGAHGTACASIIAAVPNSIGVRGFSCNVKVMAVRVYDWCLTNTWSEADFILGLQYAVQNGATVISNALSLVFDDPSDYGYQGSGSAMIDAIKAVGQPPYDVVFVTSAGNENQNLNGPWNNRIYVPQQVDYDHVINVGATDQQDQPWKASLTGQGSNYGTPNPLNIGEVSIVDIMAPGVGIRTFTGNLAAPNGTTVTGTSFSTPMVAAAAAMYRAKFPAATAPQVRAAINASARQVPFLANKCESGGILDVYELLN
jgi:subtilisin family serine protease